MLAHYRLKPLTIWLLLLAGSLVACRKEKAAPTGPSVVSAEEAKQTVARARRALEELKPAFAGLNDKLAALHREYDPLPPGLPDFGETRSKFYSMSIAVGALSAKPGWLFARLDMAAKTRDRAELAAITQDIEDTRGQLRAAESLAVRLQQEVQPFKSQAAIRMEALEASGKTTCQ